MIRVAYADPPYVGRGRYYDHDDAKRWDDPAAHVDLMAQLDESFDGWALAAIRAVPARKRDGS